MSEYMRSLFALLLMYTRDGAYGCCTRSGSASTRMHQIRMYPKRRPNQLAGHRVPRHSMSVVLVQWLCLATKKSMQTFIISLLRKPFSFPLCCSFRPPLQFDRTAGSKHMSSSNALMRLVRPRRLETDLLSSLVWTTKSLRRRLANSVSRLFSKEGVLSSSLVYLQASLRSSQSVDEVRLNNAH